MIIVNTIPYHVYSKIKPHLSFHNQAIVMHNWENSYQKSVGSFYLLNLALKCCVKLLVSILFVAYCQSSKVKVWDVWTTDQITSSNPSFVHSYWKIKPFFHWCMIYHDVKNYLADTSNNVPSNQILCLCHVIIIRYLQYRTKK